jgi:uncharacterized protein
MTGQGEDGLRDHLSAALREAMLARDPVACSALRSALAAVANSEAVPVDTMPAAGAAEHAPLGAGAADAPRRELSEHDVLAVVEAEVVEHERAAAHLSAAGRPDDAARVAELARVLRTVLDRG